MVTGYEGYLVIGVIALALFALAWRAVGRHVSVTNNVSPTAHAEAAAPAGSSQDKPSRSIIGVLAMIAVAVVVAVLAVTMIGTHAAPVAQPVSVPQVEVPAPHAIPIVPDEYVPVTLPSYQSAVDVGPLILLVAVSAVLGLILWLTNRHRHTKPIATIQPRAITKARRAEGLTHELFNQAAVNVERSKRV